MKKLYFPLRKYMVRQKTMQRVFQCAEIQEIRLREALMEYSSAF